MIPVSEPLAIRLPAPFRGSREYLHSTTLFDLLRKSTGASRNLELKLNRIITQPVRAVPAGGDHALAEAAGQFSFEDDSGPRRFAIVNEPAPEPPGRVACNEKSIMEQTEIVARTANLAFKAGRPGSLIEAVVAVNKKLIESDYAPGGKLYFTQVYLKHLPDEGRLSIRVKSHLGTKLFVSTVLMDAEELGTITFKAVSKAV